MSHIKFRYNERVIAKENSFKLRFLFKRSFIYVTSIFPLEIPALQNGLILHLPFAVGLSAMSPTNILRRATKKDILDSLKPQTRYATFSFGSMKFKTFGMIYLS